VFCRLREVIVKIKSDDISKDVLLSNLEYIATVLETAYVKETRYCSISIIIILTFFLPVC